MYGMQDTAFCSKFKKAFGFGSSPKRRACFLFFLGLSLKGFYLQNWLDLDRNEECRKMIDYLLGLIRDGKLKYDMELAPFSEFHTALDKSLGKLGSQRKQVIKF
ncbi:hypothetical protein Hanom_Chr05g00391241 [Helianthus anomalus]